MIWEQATLGTLYNVAINMRQKDYEEISALTFCNNKSELADHLSRSWSNHATSIVCGTKEDGAIAALTYIPTRKGVYNCGLYATNKFQKIHISLTKLIINSIIPVLNKAKAHRIEAQSIDGYTTVHNWLRFLGFKEESVLRNYGRNKENFINFAIILNEQDDFNWRKRGVVV